MSRLSSSGQVSDWGTSLRGDPGMFIKSGFWSPPPFSPPAIGGTIWPTINRAYFVPYYVEKPTEFSAMAINVTAAGTAGNVVRLGIFTDNNTRPGVVVDQTTVAGDSTGIRTWTFSAPIVLNGLFWLASGPQGSSTPGAIHMYSLTPTVFPTVDNGASYNNAIYSAALYLNTSVAFTDNPAVTAESTGRFPVMYLRAS